LFDFCCVGWVCIWDIRKELENGMIVVEKLVKETEIAHNEKMRDRILKQEPLFAFRTNVPINRFTSVLC
jgi:hypothetical protein